MGPSQRESKRFPSGPDIPRAPPQIFGDARIRSFQSSTLEPCQPDRDSGLGGLEPSWRLACCRRSRIVTSADGSFGGRATFVQFSRLDRRSLALVMTAEARHRTYDDSHRWRPNRLSCIAHDRLHRTRSCPMDPCRYRRIDTDRGISNTVFNARLPTFLDTF